MQLTMLKLEIILWEMVVLNKNKIITKWMINTFNNRHEEDYS